MSYSDIVGCISGLLQFVVAVYALRVSRVFGLARVGWLFFGAFSMLATIHVLLSVQPFGFKLQLGPSVNILYEIISVLLLANLAQMEFLLWNRRRKERAEQQARAEIEAKATQQAADLTKAVQQVAELTKASEELQRANVAAQAELTLLKQSQQQHLQDELQKQEKVFQEQLAAVQEQLAAARQSEEHSRGIAAGFQTEVLKEKQAHEQTEKIYQAQLAASRESEDRLRELLADLEGEVTRQREEQDKLREAAEQMVPIGSVPVPVAAPVQSAPVDPAYEAQLAAARQLEEQLRSQVTELQSRLLEQAQAQEQTESTYGELLTSLRQSGLSEVATLAQSRVAYITRIANLMRSHGKDLGKFMTRNRRGKQLPESLVLLLDYLSDEQFLLVKRIDSVKKKMDRVQQLHNQRQVQPTIPMTVIPSTPQAVFSSTESATSPGALEDGMPLGGDASTPPPVPDFLEPAASGLSAEPFQPQAEAPVLAASEPTDFDEHFLDNVTQTGTESGQPEASAPEPPAAESPVPDHSQATSEG